MYIHLKLTKQLKIVNIDVGNHGNEGRNDRTDIRKNNPFECVRFPDFCFLS